MNRYFKEGFIRLDYRIWSGWSSNVCLPLERSRTQYLLSRSFPQDWMSQQPQSGARVPGKSWRASLNSEEVGSSTKEGQDRRTWLQEQGQAGKRQKFSFCTAFYMGCRQKVWPRCRVGLLTSNDLNLGWVFHPKWSDWEKSHTGVPSCLSFS